MGRPRTFKTEHPLYNIWTGMKNRCLNPKDDQFSSYGGRGITISDRWLSFRTFVWEIGPRPSKKHSVERINNDAGYCKENCRWATAKEQGANKRNNIYIAGRKLVEIAGEMATEKNIPFKEAYRQTLRGRPRIKKPRKPYKRKIVRTISKPPNMSEEACAFRLKIRKAALSLGTTEAAIRNRLAKGWSEEKAFTTPQYQTRQGIDNRHKNQKKHS